MSQLVFSRRPFFLPSKSDGVSGRLPAVGRGSDERSVQTPERRFYKLNFIGTKLD